MIKTVSKVFAVMIVFAISINFMSVPVLPPPAAIGAYLNGVFPSTTPGEGSSWELVDPFPDFYMRSPLRMQEVPGTNEVMVLGKLGEVWQVSFANKTSKKLLDIQDRALGVGESGVVGMVLHPRFGDSSFPDKQEVYIFYPAKENPAQWEREIFLRLSKFKWDEENGVFDPDSEEILLQQYDRMTWHNGGGMFFDQDGFLNFTIGDEGRAEFREVSTQRLDGGMFSGVFRIDVDQDPTRSHPIRRQPTANAQPELPRYEGWETFTQGYYIPNDNPWLSPDSSHLEEYVALGVRSPYSTFYDREKNQIWIADVGSDQLEEINKVDFKDNLQWPYMEGLSTVGDIAKPENIIGNEKPPFYNYGREFGNCIIGGGIYRGDVFPNLNGKYLYADHGSDVLFAINNTEDESSNDIETLLTGISAEGVEFPANPSISGIHIIDNGRIYLTIIGEDHTTESKILELKQKEFVPDPPARLSDIGAFKDLLDLEPVDGFIPYRPNAQLWSDRAVKYRWMAIPNDGTHNEPSEQIQFNNRSDWVFPEGTVFIKQFDLPLTTEVDGPVKRLETRFFIIGEGDIGYGISYKWNEDDTDAFIVGAGLSESFDIFENGDFAFTQTWDYPGRTQCATCHTSNANHVLGVKTHQLNSELDYDGIVMNQIDYLRGQNIFSNPGSTFGTRLTSYDIADDSADLGLRVRSYLDANCSNCHRPNGIRNVTMDLRLTAPLPLQNIIDFKTRSEASDLDNFIIEPGNHQDSELWIRDAANSELKMPPIGRNMVDEYYVEKLAEWIDGLTSADGNLESILLYPNPSNGYVNIQLDRSWEPPFNFAILNLSGQVLMEREFDSHAEFLELGTFDNGTYIVQIQANNETHINKLVIQK